MKEPRTIERPAGSGPRAHEIGEHGTVVVSTTLDSIVVRGVAGPLARLVAPDEPGILTEATPGRFVVRTPAAPDWPAAGSGRSWLESVLSLGRGARTIELEMPRDARLEVNTASGAVHASGIRGGIAVHTASGDVTAEDVGGDLRVATASGRVSLAGPGRLAATVRSVSGSVAVSAGLLAGLTLSTLSGRVEAAGVTDPALDGSVSTASGAVRLALDGGATVVVRTVSGRTRATHPAATAGSRWPGWVIGDGAARLAVSTISGSIHLEGPRPAAAADTSASAAPDTPRTSAHDTAGAQAPESAPPALTDLPQAPVADDPTLEVLRALERGEIGVDEAAHRLEARDEESRSDA